ncbi:hypothetical protein PMI06_009959, partial [Burkholderia sp. BT03]
PARCRAGQCSTWVNIRCKLPRRVGQDSVQINTVGVPSAYGDVGECVHPLGLFDACPHAPQHTRGHVNEGRRRITLTGVRVRRCRKRSSSCSMLPSSAIRHIADVAASVSQCRHRPSSPAARSRGYTGSVRSLPGPRARRRQRAGQAQGHGGRVVTMPAPTDGSCLARTA